MNANNFFELLLGDYFSCLSLFLLAPGTKQFLCLYPSVSGTDYNQLQ